MDFTASIISIARDVSTLDSRVRVLVIRAEEDWAIANAYPATPRFAN